MLLFTFSDQGLKYSQNAKINKYQPIASKEARFTLDVMCLGFWKLSQFSDPIAERTKQQNGDSRWKNEKTKRLYFCYCVMTIISNEENDKNQLISPMTVTPKRKRWRKFWILQKQHEEIPKKNGSQNPHVYLIISWLGATVYFEVLV